MRYSPEFLEQLRTVCPIETIAANYAHLQRRGRNLVCNCPFHSEKTPSCTIFPDTQSFYCFGCGAGGDVISWVKRIENLEFSDAVKLLAERSGLEIPDDRETDQRTQMRARIYAINRETANFYYRYLVSGENRQGLAYLMQRQIRPETIRKYGLGFAPDAWDTLTKFLQKKGFSEEELLAADVTHRSKKGTLFDAFRNRVIFPIVDTKGMVIGFGGRVMDDSQPKYLNTAKTLVFDKGRNLFSLNFAKDSSSTHFILAEGYMDVIAIHQAGFPNVVATLGTAITPEQARKLSQYAKEIIIAYDSDGAGQQATQKAINRFSEVGMPTRILHMTGAKDPDEYIKKYGSERFRLLLEQAGDAISFRLDQCRTGLDSETEAGRVQILKRMVSVLAEIENPLERDVYLSRVAKQLEVTTESLQEQVKDRLSIRKRLNHDREWKSVISHTVHPEGRTAAPQTAPAPSMREVRAEERVICYLLTHPGDAAWLMESLETADFHVPLFRTVYEQYTAAIATATHFSLSALGEVLSDADMGKLSGIPAKYQEIPLSKQEIQDCIQRMKETDTNTSIQSDEELRALIQKKKHTP